MKIILPKYCTNYNLCPLKTEEEAKKYGFSYVPKKNGEEYIIYWGINNDKIHSHKKFGVMETGFFNEAAFIDTVGAYQACSLNTKRGYDAVVDFDLAGRKSAKEIIFSQRPSKQSKYNALHGRTDSFDQSIVLACQNQSDKSIGYPHSEKRYWEFIEESCKFYGKNLFIKLHPWNTGERAMKFFDLALKYNCEIGKCSMSLIEGCEFVLAFNSTIAIDCVLRDVPYVQYAMGTFWSTFGIHYSNYTLPTKIDPIPEAYKLADFLIHKYCFNKNIKDKDKYARMIKHYAESNEIFPMNDEFSYANNIE